jgi:hypothetical protein
VSSQGCVVRSVHGDGGAGLFRLPMRSLLAGCGEAVAWSLCSRNAHLRKDEETAARCPSCSKNAHDEKDWKDTHIGPVLTEQRRGWSLMIFRARATHGLGRPSLAPRSERRPSPPPIVKANGGWARVSWASPGRHFVRVRTSLEGPLIRWCSVNVPGNHLLVMWKEPEYLTLKVVLLESDFSVRVSEMASLVPSSSQDGRSRQG